MCSSDNNGLECEKNPRMCRRDSPLLLDGEPLVQVRSEPTGGAVSAPVTGNRMDDLQISFKVKK